MFEKTFSFWRRIVGKGQTATAPATPAQHDDRRLWIRYETDLIGMLRPADQQDTDKIPVTIRDISLGGANLILDRPFQPGQMLSIDIPAEGDQTRTVLACVVRIIEERAGLLSLGCVFSRELSSADLSQFGAKKVASDDADQRKWVRFACEMKASYRKVGDADDQPHGAEVLNISPNGVGLSIAPPLETGALLNVDLSDKHGRSTRTILACVVHTTTRSNGMLAAGCNFIRQLTEEELQSLL